MKRSRNFNLPSPHLLPIYQTTTFTFNNVHDARCTFADKSRRDCYSRISNPNHRELEKNLARLEKTQTAQVFATGMGAINTLFASFLKAGDHVVVITPVYGGTYGAATKIWKKFGVRFTFVDYERVDQLRKYLKHNTKLLLFETPTNPNLAVIDIEKVVAVVKEYNEKILVVADNTFATPYNQRPILLGVDIIIQSLTKDLGGYGDHLGGAVIGPKKHLKTVWEYYALLGATMDPQVAWNFARHLEDFESRMKVRNANASEIARLLELHPTVEKVYYPGLDSHPQHVIAKKQMTDPEGAPSYGGMVSFELKGPIKQTVCFLNRVARDPKSCIFLAVSLGCYDTLIESPAQMTHYHVPRKERLKQGITDKLIRLSVGRQPVNEIWSSLERQLNKVKI